MGPPILIGAGLGALTSAAMGKSPFTGALLGGATGGMFGGAGGLFGSAGAGAGAGTGIQLAQAPITEGLSTALAPTVVGGSGAAGITGLGTQALGGAGITGLGSGTLGAGITGLNTIPLDAAVNYGDVSRLAYDTPVSFGEKAFKTFENAPTSAWDWAKSNPTSALGTINSASNMMKTTPMEVPQAMPINRPNFDPSSAIPAAPSYGISKEEVAKGKVGQLASLAKLNDEDKRKIGQFYTSLIG
jgi:hypothetical protein